jgi:hypothetical protein
MIIERLAGAAGGCSRVAMSRWDGDLAIWKATWRKSHRTFSKAMLRKNQFLFQARRGHSAVSGLSPKCDA